MNNNKSTSNKINLIFSAFLVFAFMICTYFVGSYATSIANDMLKAAVPIILFLVFGLFLFYATRVGDGKPVYRFSFSVLILMVLPGLYITLAYIFEGLPLHEQITTYGETMAKIAAVVFGYGMPYMFVSGFELSNDELIEETDEIEEESEETEELEEVEETDESEEVEEIIDEGNFSEISEEDMKIVEETSQTQEDSEETVNKTEINE